VDKFPVICYKTSCATSGFSQTVVKDVSQTGVETAMCPIFPLHPSASRIDDSMHLSQELDEQNSTLRKPLPAPGTEKYRSNISGVPLKC
jgi:hypothetical protein